MNPRDVILQPIITEKSMLSMGEGKYTFAVAKKAKKHQIRQAIEALFDVEVSKVNTMQVRGKKRRMGFYEGKTADWKKAVVTLAPGDSIDFFEGML